VSPDVPWVPMFHLLVLVVVVALWAKPRDPTRRRVHWWAVVVMPVLVGATASWLFDALSGTVSAWLVAVVCGVLLAPQTCCRYVFIPCGWPRATYWLARTARWYWATDSRDEALYFASLAAVRSGSAKRWPWLATKVAAETELGGCGLLAHAIVLDAGGRTEEARRTCIALASLDQTSYHRTVRDLALEWLVAEAMTRGDFDAATEWAFHPPSARGKRAVLGQLAMHLTARDASDPFYDAASSWWTRLQRRAWALRWPALLPLLRWTLRTPAGASPTAAPRVVEPAADPRDRALDLQLRADACPAELRADGIFALALAWSAALDEPALSLWEERARALGVPPGVGERLRDAALEMLVETLRNATCELGALLDRPDAPGILHDAAFRVRSADLEVLEDSVAALEGRVSADRRLAAVDEWQEWQAIVRLYERCWTRSGLQARTTAFTVVHRPVCAQAVWLWNQRDERTVPHLMFRWLLDEAIAVGDAEAITLQRSNAKL